MRYVVGNWKMNPETEAEAIALAGAVASCAAASGEKRNEIVITPPFLFLSAVSEVVRGGNAKLGAQDVYGGSESTGAHTGEVSAAQLKRRGVAYVIVGHSERRALGETDEMVGKKLAAVIAAGMTPILCVSKKRQLRVVGRERGDKILVAYEPLWAIGTGNPSTPEDAVHMAQHIRKTVPGARVLYGGSVTRDNAASFLGRNELDGVLVGGASLSAEAFGKIIEAGLQ